jgi:predicted membrane protein
MRIFFTRLFIGIAVITIGLVLLLNNLGIVQIDTSYVISMLMAICLIGFGIDLLAKRYGLWISIVGIILILIGTDILLEAFNLSYINLSILWKIIWPLILITIGIKLIIEFRRKKDSKIAFLGGMENESENWNLEDGVYIALMAGIDLDLTKANIPEKEINLELTAIMGGIDIYVPEDVNVKCRGSVLFGGLEFFNKSTGGIISVLRGEQAANSNKVINIYCDVLFGGVNVNVKNIGYEENKNR